MFDEYYDDDIYEPTLADEILTEASAKLMDAIKQDVAAHIKAIETRNECLEADNKSLRDKVSAVNREKRELQAAREKLERRAARMSVEDFLGQRAVIMYSAGYNYVIGPKCSECDDNRRLPYKTPLGNDSWEACPCGVSATVYAPKKCTMSSMSRSRRDRSREIYIWFKKYDENSDSFSSSKCVLGENVYSDGDDFGSLDKGNTFFLDESKCQEYCDWLNSKEKEN